MKFRNLDELVFTNEPHYDLFDGGYIKPEELLENPSEAKEVNEAIVLVRQFLDEAENAGVLEIG